MEYCSDSLHEITTALASIVFADELRMLGLWAGNSDPMKPSLSAPSSVVVATG